MCRARRRVERGAGTAGQRAAGGEGAAGGRKGRPGSISRPTLHALRLGRAQLAEWADVRGKTGGVLIICADTARLHSHGGLASATYGSGGDHCKHAGANRRAIGYDQGARG
eukprot:scaffold120498_cov29-Tisochrysis_lutea.AAC.2